MKKALAIFTVLVSLLMTAHGYTAPKVPMLHDTTEVHLKPYPPVAIKTTIVVQTGGTSFEAAVAAAKKGTRILVRGVVMAKPVILPSSIIVEGEPGAKLDFSTSGIGQKAIQIPGNNVTLRNLEIANAAYHGVWITGKKNSIVNCYIHHCKNTGLHINAGGENNLIIRVNSSYNFDDKKKGAMADGFAAKEGAGANSFDSCIADGNSDDGFDFYAAHGVQKVYNCVARGSGVAEGNGIGFKVGGVDNKTEAGKARPHLEPLNHLLVNCLADSNRNRGFDRNDNSGTVKMVRCVGKNNGQADFYFPYKVTPSALGRKEAILGKNCIIRDCISTTGKNLLAGAVVEGNCIGFK